MCGGCVTRNNLNCYAQKVLNQNVFSRILQEKKCCVFWCNTLWIFSKWYGNIWLKFRNNKKEIKGKKNSYVITKLFNNTAISNNIQQYTTISMQLVKLTEISKILTDSCFLISRLLKHISLIFMTKISTNSLTIVLKLGQDKLSFCLA